jgi:hypothetical protein
MTLGVDQPLRSNRLKKLDLLEMTDRERKSQIRQYGNNKSVNNRRLIQIIKRLRK